MTRKSCHNCEHIIPRKYLSGCIRTDKNIGVNARLIAKYYPYYSRKK